MIARYLPPHGGGIGAYTEKTARALCRAGHDVHVFSESLDAAQVVDVVEGVTVHRLPRQELRPRELRLVTRAWAVDAAIRREGCFDIVQACEWDAEAAVYAAHPRAPLVTRLATPHQIVAELNDAPTRERRRQSGVRRMERWQASRSARVISPSRAMAELLTDDWQLSPGRVRVVPTGIRMPLWEGEADRRLPRPYVLFFGRLEVRKGVHTWLQALPEVLRVHPQITAVFAGEDLGIGGRSFLDYAREVTGGFWDRLQFLPHMPHTELFPVIAGAELVVLPSRWENLPNACLEAMALGKPVLGTTGSAFEEIIDEGTSGFLAPPDDSTALAAAALRALEDHHRLQAVGHAARRRAQDFDIDAMASRLIDVYQELARQAS